VNISSVTNNLAASTSGSNDTSYLQKQEAGIEQQIQQENSSKDDTKTKQVKIAELQAQLQQIQAQIQSPKTRVASSEQIKPSVISNSNNNKSSTTNIIDELV